MADTDDGIIKGADEFLATLTRAFGDRYDLVGKIGHGAYGVVYRATDTVLDRDVAIKQVRLDRFHDPAHVAEVKLRTQREAQMAARLRHPNIVAIHDIVHTDTSTLLIMEYVEGETLDAKLAHEQRLNVEQTLAIVTETADALDHAHALGVIHRDIKPANLMIDRSGHVKITDFGIAKSQSGSEMTSNITATGNVLGTPYYMSPEQARGEATLDGRADQFSLGCVAYECLSGQRPFRGKSVVDVLLQIVNAEPIELDCESLELHPDIEPVLGKALAKKAALRYASASELVESLRAVPVAESGASKAIPVVTTREPGVSASFDVDFQGQLSNRALPQLLQDIQTTGKTGILHLHQEELNKRLYFRDGGLVFANSDLESDRLGQFLIRSEVIDESSYARAIRAMRKTGHRLGTTLVALGTVDEERLEAEIENQIQSIIYSVFSWESGSYGFETIAPPVEEDIARKLSTDEILLEGVRSMASDTTIRKAIGNLDRILVYAEGTRLDEQKVTLTSTEGFVLSRVDGAASLAEIVAISPLDEAQTLRCVYGLISTGILRLSDPEGKSTTRARKVAADKPEHESLHEEIATKHASLNDVSHYELLEVSRGASPGAIKKAYYALAKKFHPDRHQGAGQDVQNRLQEILASLSSAYEVLSSTPNRLRYDHGTQSSAEADGDAAPTAQTSPDVIAETKYRAALSHFKVKAYHDAVVNLREAVRLSPTKIAYHKLLGQALAKNPKWRKQAESHFQTVLDAEPFDTDCYLELAEIYESRGLTTRARKMYEKALTLDPEHEFANRKLRAEPYTSRAVFLRKLMGKADDVSH